MAQQFLDGQETGADSNSLVNLHNNGAGRVVSIRYTLKLHELKIIIRFLIYSYKLIAYQSFISIRLLRKPCDGCVSAMELVAHVQLKLAGDKFQNLEQ